jgi:hypothetical protein
LRVVMAHLGHPWHADTVTVICKHPHVYADVSSQFLRPWGQYQALRLATEWGVLDKLLLGSDYPVATPQETIDGPPLGADVAARANLPLSGSRRATCNRAPRQPRCPRPDLTWFSSQAEGRRPCHFFALLVAVRFGDSTLMCVRTLSPRADLASQECTSPPKCPLDLGARRWQSDLRGPRSASGASLGTAVHRDSTALHRVSTGEVNCFTVH